MIYKIKSTSIFYYILIVFLLFVIVGLFFKYYIGIIESMLIAGVAGVIVVVSVFYISNKLTTGLAEVKLNSKYVQFKWTKRPLLTFQNEAIIYHNSNAKWSYRSVGGKFPYDYIKIYNSQAQIVIIDAFIGKWNTDFYRFKEAYKKRMSKNEVSGFMNWF